MLDPPNDRYISPEWGKPTSDRGRVRREPSGSRLLPTAAEGQEYGHLICCESDMGARHCIICRSQCPLRAHGCVIVDDEYNTRYLDRWLGCRTQIRERQGSSFEACETEVAERSSGV